MIGIVTCDFYPLSGGIGRSVFSLYTMFSNKGDSVIVISPCQNNLAHHVRLSNPFKFVGNAGFSIAVNRHMNAIVRAHNLKKLNLQCGPGGVFLLKRACVPVIATCHHTYWQQSHYIRSQWWKRIFIPFEKRTYALSDAIVCVSGDTRQILIDRYHINPAKITVIPNCVDLTHFHPMNIKRVPRSILYVGRVDKRKGVDFLVASMTFVLREFPDAKLYIGGQGKDLAKLQAYVSAKQLEKNVIFLGYIPDNDLNRWYNRVSCIVVPSVFEGFGITVIEAMASGTPVIGTNVDGIKWIIQDKVNGRLVEYNNLESLSTAIKQVFLQKNQKISIRALRDVKTRFNKNNVMKQYSKVWYG